MDRSNLNVLPGEKESEYAERVVRSQDSHNPLFELGARAEAVDPNYLRRRDLLQKTAMAIQVRASQFSCDREVVFGSPF